MALLGPGANNTGKSEKMGSVNAMSTEVLDNLIKQAERLSPDEQLRLAAYLVERAIGYARVSTDEDSMS
jgi:hypothetical protein